MPRRVLAREDASEYVGGDEMLKLLESEYGLKAVRATRTSKTYDIRELDAAVDCLRARRDNAAAAC